MGGGCVGNVAAPPLLLPSRDPDESGHVSLLLLVYTCWAPFFLFDIHIAASCVPKEGVLMTMVGDGRIGKDQICFFLAQAVFHCFLL